MHGNAWEWCQDYYGPYEGLEEKDTLRMGKLSEYTRVLRGGSWHRDALFARSSGRYRFAPASRYFGFRVAFFLD
jgi:formylglycine-generating enzyme